MQKTSVVAPVLNLALAFGVPPASRAHDPHDRHRTFHVSTAAELVEALATVDPGDTIRLRPGIYTVPAGTPAIPPATIPEFGSSRSGTPRHPIPASGRCPKPAGRKKNKMAQGFDGPRKQNALWYAWKRDGAWRFQNRRQSTVAQ